MKHIVVKMIFCSLMCFISLYAFGVETDQITNGQETNQAQLLTARNDFDNSATQQVDTVEENVADTVVSESPVAKVTVVPNEENMSSDYFSVSNVVSIIAMIMAIVALSVSKKKKENSVKVDYNDEIKKLVIELERMQNSLACMQNQIENLSSVRLQQQELIQQSQLNTIVGTMMDVEKPVETVRYSTTIKGNIFPFIGIKDTADEFTVCVLTLSGDSGTFVINSAPDAQPKILSNFNYGLSNIVNVKSKIQRPTSVKTIRRGKIKKVGNDWQIVEKAEVELC